MQDIKSLIAVPLASRDKVWGYAGIDIVNEPRRWSGEDYQWFASLMNIISLCIELQRSEKEAQSERTYLESLYRHMPLGYVRLRVIYDEKGVPDDFVVLDSNFAADMITGASREAYIGKKASELNVDMNRYIPVLMEVLNGGGYVERDTCEGDENRWLHSTLYSVHKDEVIGLFSDTTDVHAAHEALFNSEKLLRNIFDNVQVGVELYDKDGVLVDLNNKDLEIFGISAKGMWSGSISSKIRLSPSMSRRRCVPEKTRHSSSIIRSNSCMGIINRGRPVTWRFSPRLTCLRHERRAGQLRAHQHRQHGDQPGPQQTGRIRELVRAGKPLR